MSITAPNDDWPTVTEGWYPTLALRFEHRTEGRRYILQQEWQSIDGKREWRDVETVEEGFIGQ